jgi:hypothetical protein
VGSSHRLHSGAGAGAARRTGRPGWGKIAACAVIAAVAAVTIGLSVRQDLRATAGYVRPVSAGFAVLQAERISCLYHLIRHDLPRNARVYIDSTNVNHIQRLSELSTPWALPQPTAATAQWEIDIVHGDCYKIGLKVRHL